MAQNSQKEQLVRSLSLPPPEAFRRAWGFQRRHASSARPGRLTTAKNSLAQLERLALACPVWNYEKVTNLTGVDPDTGKVTRLFHPRRHRWQDPFARDAARLMGKTPEGRTTVWLLNRNAGDRLRWRELLLRLGLPE